MKLLLIMILGFISFSLFSGETKKNHSDKKNAASTEKSIKKTRGNFSETIIIPSTKMIDNFGRIGEGGEGGVGTGG